MFRRIGLFPVMLLVASLALAGSSSEPPGCILGDQALAGKQPDLAVIEYNRCLSKNPPTFKILSNLGIAYAQQNQFSEAIQAYVQALALEPDNAIVRENLGLAYMKTNRPKEAAEQFARSLMADSGNGKTLELLAYCHLKLGEYALAAYEAGLVHQASPGDPSAAYILGVSYMQLGMYVQAIPLVVNSLSRAKSAEAYMTLGEAWLGVRNSPKALEAFQNAEKMDPKLPGVYADLGEALTDLGEMEEAKAAYLKELARDPGNFKANYMLGQLDRLIGNDAEAGKYLEKANELQPGAAGPAYELAALAMQEQDYQKAERILESVVQQLPSFTNAHVLLAQAYSRLHKTEQSTRERAIAAALQKADHARLQAEGERLKWLSGGKSAAQAAGKQ
ncbi:MAG: tetratricopeptide repeat protein [Terriglobia bacterium]